MRWNPIHEIFPGWTQNQTIARATENEKALMRNLMNEEKVAYELFTPTYFDSINNRFSFSDGCPLWRQLLLMEHLPKKNAAFSELRLIFPI